MKTNLETLKKQFDRVLLKHDNTPTKSSNGKTIAVLWKGDERFVGVSECSDKDQFSRKKGRLVALSRALYASRDDREIQNRNDYGKYIYRFDLSEIPEMQLPEHLYLPKGE